MLEEAEEVRKACVQFSLGSCVFLGVGYWFKFDYQDDWKAGKISTDLKFRIWAAIIAGYLGIAMGVIGIIWSYVNQWIS